MALRDQPYLPLYIQDFLTDEKLLECSAEATGVYIRLMCVMHKSEEYGTILLKQKNQQTGQQVQDFACQLAKNMPYKIEVIHKALHELIEEGVIQLNDRKLLQKRMIRDNSISKERSKAGQKGGFATAKLQAKGTAKGTANAEYETEYVNETENVTEDVIETVDKGGYRGEIDEIVKDLNEVLNTTYKPNSKKTAELIRARIKEGFTVEDFKKVHRNMSAAWGYDTKMVKYLRPMTLYSPKFESYLNIKASNTQLSEAGVASYNAGKEWLRKRREGKC